MDLKDGRSRKKLTDFSIDRILSPDASSSNVMQSLYPYYLFSSGFVRPDINENNWIKDDSLKCNICGKVFAFIFDLTVSSSFFFKSFKLKEY